MRRKHWFCQRSENQRKILKDKPSLTLMIRSWIAAKCNSGRRPPLRTMKPLRRAQKNLHKVLIVLTHPLIGHREAGHWSNRQGLHLFHQQLRDGARCPENENGHRAKDAPFDPGSALIQTRYYRHSRVTQNLSK